MFNFKTSFIYIFLFIMLIIFFIISFKYGKEAGLHDCEEQKTTEKQETIEVIKYIYKDEAQIYIRPNSTLDELIKRMEKGEI